MDKSVLQLKAHGKKIGDSRVLSHDWRINRMLMMTESPSYVLMEKLEAMKAINYYDPNIPFIRPSREYSHFAGRQSVELNEITIEDYDLAIISTIHDGINYNILAESGCLIIDTRGVLVDEKLGANYMTA